MKTCFTCLNYGRCAIQNKTCPDWSEWDGQTIVLNLEAFNGLWLGLHKKWWESYPSSLLEKRKKTIQLYLAGETEKQITERLSSTISEEVLKELDKYERKED